jgi:hypothetical protein
MRSLAASIGLVCVVCGGAAQLPQAAPGSAEPARAEPVNQAPLSPPALDAGQPAEYPGLHNVVTYAPNFFSGSAPDGDDGFDSLKALGIKTIISVDGAAPTVDPAHARGLRYIHLPIGYNGMDEARTLQMARAVKEALARGPVYLHCHHGKHRAAGAAGAAAVTLGLLSNGDAIRKLRISGTAPNYPGLYACVNAARLASAAALAAADSDFPEIARTSGLVQTMVEADQVNDHLKAIEKAGWATPADDPDLVPAAEAGHLADLFRNLKDDPKVQTKPQEFRDWLGAASRRAGEVEESLATPPGKGATPEDLSAKFKLVSQSCTQCHAKYRD